MHKLCFNMMLLFMMAKTKEAEPKINSKQQLNENAYSV